MQQLSQDQIVQANMELKEALEGKSFETLGEALTWMSEVLSNLSTFQTSDEWDHNVFSSQLYMEGQDHCILKTKSMSYQGVFEVVGRDEQLEEWPRGDTVISVVVKPRFTGPINLILSGFTVTAFLANVKKES